MQAFLSQTANQKDFEVVVVDDGSTDGTIQAYNNYKDKIANLKVVQLPENTGSPIVPRNTGVKIARGEYVFFHDSDDYLLPDAVEKYFDIIDRYQSDVIYPRLVGDNGRKAPEGQFLKGELSDAEFFEDNLAWNLNPQKLFKKSLVIEHGVRFMEEAPNFEDHVFSIQAMLNSKRISVMGDAGTYVLTQHEGVHLSADNWNRDAKTIYHTVNLMLEIISERFYLSPIQEARWSTALLRRHLRQIQEKILKLSESRSAELVKELQSVIERYAQIGWLSFLPKPYHEIYKALLTNDAMEIVQQFRNGKGDTTDVSSINKLQTSDVYDAVKWMSTGNDKFFLKKREFSDISDIVFIDQFGFDEYGLPFVLREGKKIPMTPELLKLPTINQLNLMKRAAKLRTQKLVVFEDAKVLKNGNVVSLARADGALVGVPLQVEGFMIDSSDNLYAMFNGLDILIDDINMVVGRKQIEDYFTRFRGKVIVKHPSLVYNSVDFKKQNEIYRTDAAQEFDVLGVAYTAGGTPRLKIKDGYITANRKFVMERKNAFSRIAAQLGVLK